MPQEIKKAEIDNEAKLLKRHVEGWREIILHANGLLLWEKSLFPAFIFGGTSLVFLVFWYLDPTLLTTISVLGLLITMADFLVPTISVQMFGIDYWNSAKEKKFDEVCYALASKKLSLTRHFVCFTNMRSGQPKKFYAILAVTFAFLAWIGSSINNLFLTYLTVITILMVPGVSKRGWLSPLKSAMAMICCGGKETKKLD